MKENDIFRVIGLFFLLLMSTLVLSYVSNRLWDKKAYKKVIDRDIVVSSEMTLREFGKTNRLPDKVVQRIFSVKTPDDFDAEISVQQLTMMIEMANPRKNSWKPLVVKTCARQGDGVEELAQAFLTHYGFMEKNQSLAEKKKEQESIYFTSLLRDLTIKKLLMLIQTSSEYSKILNRLAVHEIDPITAAEQVVKKVICS